LDEAARDSQVPNIAMCGCAPVNKIIRTGSLPWALSARPGRHTSSHRSLKISSRPSRFQILPSTGDWGEGNLVGHPHPCPRGCVAIPFMVREPHHERNWLII